MCEKDNLPLGFCCETESNNDPLYFANVSDSDSTSPDSEDSLELSESESITDVTPLNSPYCDSPLPQLRAADVSQMKDSFDEAKSGEMNVLIQAIKKLEVEKSQGIKTKASSSHKKRGEVCSLDSMRMDTETCLLKHVMGQQGRVKSSSSHDRLLHRKSTVINRHRQLASIEGENKISRPPREASHGHQSRRQMKCMSHPSCSPYSFSAFESTVQCSKELKSVDCPSSSSLNTSADAMSSIDSNVIAH